MFKESAKGHSAISVGLGQSDPGRPLGFGLKFTRPKCSRNRPKVTRLSQSDSAKVHSARPLGFGQSSFGKATRIRPKVHSARPLGFGQKFTRPDHSDSAIAFGLGIAVGLGHRTRTRHCSRTRPPYSDSALQSDSAIVLGLGHAIRMLVTVARHQASSSRLSERTA